MSSSAYSKKFKFSPPKEEKKKEQAADSQSQDIPKSITSTPEKPLVRKKQRIGGKWAGKRYYEYKLTMGNENLYNLVRKRNIVYVEKFLLDYSNNMDVPFVDMKKTLRKFKYIGLFSFYSTKILPKPASQILRLLFSNARGLNIPLLIRSKTYDELTMKTKLFRGFKRLTSLRLETYPAAEGQYSFHKKEELRLLHSHLSCLRQLSSFCFEELCPKISEELIELLAKQIKSRSKTLEYVVISLPEMERTYPGKRTADSSTKFMASFQSLERLSYLSLSVDGSEIYEENIKQLCASLENKKNLQKCHLTLNHPTIIKRFEKFNTIPNLELDIEIILNRFKTESINYLSNLDCIIRISVDEVSNRRLASDQFMKTFFKALSEIKHLARFSYHEGFEQPTEHGRENLALNFPVLLKNVSHLKKLDLDLTGTYRGKDLFVSLANHLKDMVCLDHFELAIFDYNEDDECDESILELVTGLQTIQTLKDLFISIDGGIIENSFVRKLMDKMTKCKQVIRFGSLCMKVNRKNTVEFLKKMSRMPDLENILLWFRPQPFYHVGGVTDPSDETIMNCIVEAISCLKNLRTLGMSLPFDLEEAELDRLAKRIKATNKFLIVSLEGPHGLPV